MTSPKKTRDPKLSKFFSMQSGRLAVSFEGLNSSLAQSPGELWSCTVAGKCGQNVGFRSTNISNTGAESV